MEKFDITKRYNKKEVLELDPLDLLEWVVTNMKIKIPNQITPENQEEVSIELSKSIQYETYLSEMADRADLMKRKLKMDGEKDASSLMLMRENVLKGHATRMKHSYETISRLFSIKNQELQELKMMGLTS